MVIFGKVAEHGGITAAASALSMPKSRVSRRVVALEQALGARLLERTTRSIRLTEVGRIYFHYCKRVYEESESGRESIHNFLETPRGLLRISTSVSIGQVLLAPHLSEFNQRYPEVDLDINLSNRRVDLVGEGFDLAIRVGQLKDSTLVSKNLGSAQAKLYASPQYLQKSPPIDCIEQIKAHSIITMSDASYSNQWLLENESGQQHLIDVAPKISMNDMIGVRNIAMAGAGIVLIPNYLASDAILNGQLKVVLPKWSTRPFGYYMLYPSRLGLTMKIKAWSEFIFTKLESTFGE